VREAIAPVEGEGTVWDFPEKHLWEELVVDKSYKQGRNFVCFHKRVLNIVTTRAELREVRRARVQVMKDAAVARAALAAALDTDDGAGTPDD
jgi:hypothetical protein